MNSDPLDSLYWRDEILEAMYWMKGEGIASEVDAEDLLPLLNTGNSIISQTLCLLFELGDLELTEASKYRLSAKGHEEAKRRFYSEFKEHLSRDAHGGQCDEDCECHDAESRTECEAER